MSWRNRRWNSLKGPDAETLRAIFYDLEKFLKNPTFEEGFELGTDGVEPTVDVSTGVVTPPSTEPFDRGRLGGIDTDLVELASDLDAAAADLTALEGRFPIQEVDIGDDQISTPKLQANSVTAAELAAINIAVGKWIASTDYDPGVAGWIIEADGTAEFNDVTVRGDVYAEDMELEGLVLVQQGSGFEASTESWAATTNCTVTRVTANQNSGVACLEINATAAGDFLATSDYVPFEGGRDHEMRTWVNNVHADYCDIYITTYDSSHAVIDATYQIAAVPMTAGWNELRWAIRTDDTNIAYIKWAIGAGFGTVAINDKIRVDDWQLWRASRLGGAVITTADAVDGNGASSSLRAGRLDLMPAHSGTTTDIETSAIVWSANTRVIPTGVIRPLLRLDTAKFAGRGVARIDLEGESEDGTLPTGIDLVAEEIVLTAGDLRFGSDDEPNVLAGWIPYAPSHSNITYGLGTETAAYMLIGKTCHVRWRFVFGAGSAFGTSARVGLPFAPAYNQVGVANYAVSGGRVWPGSCLASTSDNRAPLYHIGSGNNGAVNATNPFTFAAGDVATMGITYEIA